MSNSPAESPSGAAPVQAVGMAFAVLEELARAGEAVGTSELARRLGETKARVHRHLQTLRELGFVEKDAAGDGYRLGWKTWRLGLTVSENFGLRRLAHPHLVRLHKDSGQTVALAIPAGATDVTVVDEIQDTEHIAITIRPGSVIPAVSAALGRAILAFRSGQERAAVLAAPVSPLTAATEQDTQRITQLLDAVARDWYAVAANERLPGIAALAAPVFDSAGRAIASVGVIGSHAVVTQPPPLELVAQVQQAAARISAELHSTAWQQAQFHNKTETSHDPQLSLPP